MTSAGRAVHLVNPPSAPGTTANREGAAGLGVVYPSPGAFLYPPHTLATVVAALRRDRWDVRAYDAAVQEIGAELEADAIGVFVSYATLDTDIAYISSLRQRFVGRIFAFGPSMRFLAEELLDRARVDCVLAGEAEGFCGQALELLTQSQVSQRQVWWPKDVKATCCDDEGFILDLDAVPMPAWDALPYQQYALLTVLGSRGCPGECAYCPYAAAQGHRFRARSVANVLDELGWLADRFQPDRVVFRDPVFAHDEERVVALCEGMMRREIRLRWECESRPEHLNGSLLRLMQRAGCQWIKIGLETTDAMLLQSLGRLRHAHEADAYLDQVAAVVRDCRSIGLNCRVFVMAGLPGQTEQSARQTLRFLGQLRPGALNVKACEPYPGTAALAESPGQVQAQLNVLSRAESAVRQSQRIGLLPRAKRWLRRQLGERR